MTFLNPFLLIGLVAAGIPLIIHLFNFRRPRRVDFSSLVFLRELRQTTMRRVRLKQWLLLLLRTLAIAAVVVAFARPTVSGRLAGAMGGSARTSTVVVLDNSLSMSMRDRLGSYWQQATGVTSALGDRIQSGDDFTIVPLASTVAPRTFRNRASVADALSEMSLGRNARSITDALDEAHRLLAESNNLNKELFVVSDFQTVTLRDTAATGANESVWVAVIPVGSGVNPNVGVVSARVASRIVEIDQPVRFVADVQNFGRQALDDYVVSLHVDGVRAAQSTVSLPPGEARQIVLTATPPERGWRAVRVELEEDLFEFDNTRHLALHVPERRTVLIVRGQGQTTDHLRLALSPEVARGRAIFEVETIAESALSATPVERFDVVVLLGVESISSGETSTIERYVKNGGGLLVFPGEKDSFSGLSAVLGAGRVDGLIGTDSRDAAVASMTDVDREHPLFEGVFDDVKPGAEVESPDVFRHVVYRPGSQREQTLIGMSNGHPLLQEIRAGLGAVLFMTVAPRPEWTTLPVSGLFVPLLYRSIYYLAAAQSVEGDQIEIGTVAEIRVVGVAENDVIAIRSDDFEFTPHQRTVFGATLLSIDDNVITEPGVYDLVAREQLVRRVAANVGPSESDLSRYSVAEAAERIEAITGSEPEVLQPGDGGVQRMMTRLAEAKTGLELWNVFLLAALGLFVAEMLVAKFWRPESAQS